MSHRDHGWRRTADRDPAEQELAEPGAVALSPRHSAVLGLHSAGNRAVANLVTGGATSHTTTVATPFTARIPMVDHDLDPEPGNETAAEIDLGQVTSAVLSAAPPADAAPDGGSVRLPDMAVPEGLVTDADSVAGVLAYSGTVAQSGAVSPFGATKWSQFAITGITVTPGPGFFVVAATVSNPITFNVASGGRTDIPSETAAALTAANYATASSDLTPNMSDLGGRPPRTLFWAQDLTVRHERFHAIERQTHGTIGTVTAAAWLNSQSAGSVADVQALLAAVPARIIAYSQANMAMPAKEERAYGDGAPSYRARADAIKARGDAGGYP